MVVALRVWEAKVGVDVVAIDCGKDNVIAPVPLEAMTWLAVPVMERTPELAIEILPFPLVILIPLPWVKLATEYPLLLLPIKS